MTPDKSKSDRVLILTVGTGNRDFLETSLFVPLIKSMETEGWKRIVLLPSQVTDEFAQSLRERKRELPIEISPLPGDELEYDADACFGHFDSVIGELIVGGLAPNQITADFTRGTKAMSAALVLAATGRKVPTLRYIDGTRGGIGQVQPGTEKIKEIKTALATARRRLDDAKALMRHGNFGGAAALLDIPVPTSSNAVAQAMEAERVAVRAAAEVYGAWDRLNYRAAFDAIADTEKHTQALLGEFSVPPKVREWLGQLARQPDKGEHDAMARYLRNLVCDLVVNGERRIRASQFEDALLRGYRVLELLGQIRLFDRGMDSGAIPADHKNVQELKDDVDREHSHKFGENRDRTLTAGKELVARLLNRMGDELGRRLLDFDDGEDAKLKAQRRNLSVLTHGFGAAAPSESGPLEDMFRRLRCVLVKDDPDANYRISIAQWVDDFGPV